MDQKTKNIIWKLYKKGKKNWTDLDKILIESNPSIKKELKKLYNVDDNLYQKTLEKINEKKQKIKNHHIKGNLKFLLMAAMATLLAVTIINHWSGWFLPQPSPQFLGKPLTLLVSSTDTPQNLLTHGQKITPGQRLRISFQATGESSNYKEGVVLAIDNSGKNRILYDYNYKKNSLNQIEPTIVDEDFRTTQGNYVLILLLFSTENLATEQIIENLSNQSIQPQSDITQWLPGKKGRYKIDYIYLQGIGM